MAENRKRKGKNEWNSRKRQERVEFQSCFRKGQERVEFQSCFSVCGIPNHGLSVLPSPIYTQSSSQIIMPIKRLTQEQRDEIEARLRESLKENPEQLITGPRAVPAATLEEFFERNGVYGDINVETQAEDTPRSNPLTARRHPLVAMVELFDCMYAHNFLDLRFFLNTNTNLCHEFKIVQYDVI